MLKKSVLFLGAVALSMSSVASAHASGENVSTMACGYYETATDAYYSHCTNATGPMRGARIEIDHDWTIFNTYKCVSPGETRLGTTGEIDNAWYLESCWVG